MDWMYIFKKPFLIPSLIAGLIVAFRIFMLLFQYVQKKVRNRRRDRVEKDKKGRPPTGRAGSPKPPR